VYRGSGGQESLALGNVIGSNIFNVLMVLGIAAMVAPLVVHQRIVRIEAPLVLGLSVLVMFMAYDRTIGRVDGIVLLTGLLLYIVFTIRAARKETKAVEKQYTKTFSAEAQKKPKVMPNIGLIVAGGATLVYGSSLLVDSAVTIFSQFGVSDLVIGLTVIAAGTSLPEAATTLVASWRGQRDIAVGNVVGSSTFNILAVLGLAAVFAPSGVSVSPDAFYFNLPVMIAVAFAMLPICWTGMRIDRWEGAFFIIAYICYTIYLVADAKADQRMEPLSIPTLAFVVPLLAVTVVVIGASRASRKRRLAGGADGADEAATTADAAEATAAAVVHESERGAPTKPPGA
jgi:cation:H+ antiporter